MHHHPSRWPHFRRLHPRVFRKSGRYDHMLIVDYPGSWNVIRLRQFVNLVRLTDSPALDPIDWRRDVLRITLGRACIGPLRKRFDFSRTHANAVRKFSIMWVRKPRRHFAVLYRYFHCHRPWSGLFVRQQRKWPGFTRPMAHLAFVLQNRRDVFCIGWCIASRSAISGLAKQSANEQKGNQRKRHSQFHIYVPSHIRSLRV